VADKVLRIKQVRSRIGRTQKQHQVLRTLGLRHIGDVVERPDNPAVRGAVLRVQHLVTIENEATPAPAAKKAVKVTKRTADAAPAKKKTTEKAAAKAGTGEAAKKKAAKKKAAKKKATKKKVAKKAAKKKASGGKS
jgi:ribosomal protein L30